MRPEVSYGQTFSKTQGSVAKKRRREGKQNDDVGPEMLDAGAFEKNFPLGSKAVAHGIDKRGVLEKDGHVFDWEKKVGKNDKRKDHSENCHHSLLLRFADR